MPQAKRGGSGSGSSSSRAGGRASGARSGAAKTKSTRAKSSARSSSARSTRASSDGAAADPRVEAAAQRIRKLNERIIEDGKKAGEATLTSYEKVLKSIASSIERGPGSSDVEWISNLATVQAKFLRDVTEAWTKAARSMIK